MATLVWVPVLAACASGPAEFLRRPAQRVGWPPGDEPRIEVVMTWRGADDVERHPGLWSRFKEGVFGDEDVALASPNGMALSPEDDLYVADAGRGVVHKLSLRSGQHEVLTGTEQLPLKTPIGLALLADGRLVVTDSALGHLLVFTADGRPERVLGSPGELGRPTGIVLDRRHERLLVVDTTGGRVLALATDGRKLADFGRRGVESGELNFPTNLALTAEGNVLVCDSMNFRVQEFTPEFQFVRAVGAAGRGPGTFASPKGIALDSEGHLYVVDAMFANVQVFDAAGHLLITFASRGNGFGELELPTGILIDGRDRIFVSDAGNSRIQVFQYHRRPR